MLLSLGKTSCDRVALPNLRCMPGVLGFHKPVNSTWSTRSLTLSLPLGRHMRSVAKYTEYCDRMLNANFLRKLQLLVHSEATLSSKDENFWSL